MSRSISSGSWPRTHSARPRQILCERGASMIALATSADESTSPTPQMPASVCTLTTRVSWLPSQRSFTWGKRRWIASMLVIFIGYPTSRVDDNFPGGSVEKHSLLVQYVPTENALLARGNGLDQRGINTTIHFNLAPIEQGSDACPDHSAGYSRQ